MNVQQKTYVAKVFGYLHAGVEQHLIVLGIAELFTLCVKNSGTVFMASGFQHNLLCTLF